MCSQNACVTFSQSQLVCSQLLLCPPKDFVFPHIDLSDFKGILVIFTITFYIHIMTCLLYIDYVLHSITVWPSKWHGMISTIIVQHTLVLCSLTIVIYDLIWVYVTSQVLCVTVIGTLFVMLLMTCVPLQSHYMTSKWLCGHSHWLLRPHSYLLFPHHIFVPCSEWVFVSFKRSLWALNWLFHPHSS